MNKLMIIGVVMLILTTSAIGFVSTNVMSPVQNQDSLIRTAPDCIKMYFYIKAYADTFNIPHKYAFGIANAETNYRGPLQMNYNPRQRSYSGALGPMQIMPSTASLIEGKAISKHKLKNDVEYNVKLSMKILRILYNKYGDWKLVFGAYNTGRPIINKYAIKVFNYDIPWTTEAVNNTTTLPGNSFIKGGM